MKKLPPAKTPLPKFPSDKEVADYFEKHSVAGVWGQLTRADLERASKELEKKIRDRHSVTKARSEFD